MENYQSLEQTRLNDLKKTLKDRFSSFNNELIEYCSLKMRWGYWSEIKSLILDLIKLEKHFTFKSEEIGYLQAIYADILWKTGNIKDAEVILVEAEKRAQNANDFTMLSNIYYNLGEIYYVKSSLMKLDVGEQAVQYHEQAFDLRKTSKDKKRLTLSLSRLGVIFERSKQLDKAKDYYQEAIKISDLIDYELGKTRPLTHLAVLEQREGNVDRAITLFQQSLELHRKYNFKERLVFGLVNLAQAIYEQDSENIIQSNQMLAEAEAVAKSINFKLAMIRVQFISASIYESSQQLQLAKGCYKTLIRIAEECGYVTMIEIATKAISDLS